MSLTNENDMGVEMEMNTPSPGDDMPPPPPPKEWRAAALPAPVEAPAKVATPAPGPPRLKKKVPWKGKNILVLLPWDDERGQKGKAPTPLTEKDMAAMLKEWGQLGYDTSGFNLGPDVSNGDEGSQGQSRSPWPLVQDLNQDRTQRNYRVSIPKRKEWDDYVQELKEAKLRALGVSFGDEEPAPTMSPAVSNLPSRRTSMQYPALPFSPPLPTSSAASSHLTQHQNPFSPLLMPGAGMSTSQSSNPGSVASPASMHAQMHGKYNPRQSVSFSGNEHPFGSPFQYPQQNSPGVWSPQQMLYQQGHAARGGSPSLANLGSMMSPASPFSQDGYFPQGGDVMSQMQQRQQLLQTQLAHQQQLQLQGGARASPRLQEVREIDNEDEPLSKSPSKTPEARLRNNPNDLQKEIDDAEYHLEEQMQRELEHDDYSPHSDKDEDKFPQNTIKSHTKNTSSLGLGASRYASDGPVLHHPQPHSRGHSLSQRPFQDSEESAPESKRLLGKPDLSDIETNPSNLGTPVQTDLSGTGHDRSLSAASNPWADSDANQTENSTVPPRKGHKARMSTLNVGAKEFKFNPSKSFAQSQFAFNGNSFQSPINAFTAFAPPVSATSSHFSHGSIASSSKINVAAPAFTPGHKEFSFSASGPSFRPDAPAFTPLNSTFSDSVGSASEGPRGSIFGNIDLSALGISKPSKKNKAIPIIRPDSSYSKDLENEDVEDEGGRLTQGAGRVKRARGAKDDGDSVPLFAEPSMPLGETTRQQSPPKESLTVSTAPADKENSAPLENTPAESSARTEESGKEFSPWEFQEKKQAEDFNAARPFTSRRYGSGLPAYGNYEPSEDEFAAPVEDPQKPKGHKKNMSSLSATAKPFEFRPGAFNFTFGESSESVPAPSSVPSLPPSLPASAGLSASRFARSPTPPTLEAPTPPESPETNMQPDERAQFQESLPQAESLPPYVGEENRDKTFQEQSLEEIDEVMRLMNEAELAPRQDATVFAQPSPQRHINMPDPNNSSPIRLLPQHVMRSDAPSPSPRRFQALPGESRIFSRVNDDPFVADESPAHHLNNMDSLPPSEWDDVLSETEEAKLLPRAQFFDNHVNDLVGGLLSQRLEPLERTLENVQMSLDMMAARGQSTRRERRSISGALSDADDEDDDNARRSLSPRRDKKFDKIRAIVTEALAAHQTSRPTTATTASGILPDSRNVLQALEEMKEQFGQSMRLDLRGEDLRNIVEEAVEKRLPASPRPVLDEATISREAEYKAKIAELEERLFRFDSENTSRVADVEEKLLRADIRTEEETKSRRAAEDRLAEVQRLLRISSEEEVRLRESMDERELKIREIVDASDLKVRTVEEQRAKTTMRIALLEAAQDHAQKTQTELQNRLNVSDNDLRGSRVEVQRWQMEAERALDAARRHSEDAEQANETNKELRHTIESLRTQMEESIRVREGMRGKLMDLQGDMASAAREISEENARRAKKEQELIARQEVLDARLQAEARTRERLELEIERLEGGEREGMRAVSDLKKLEVIVDDLRTENNVALKDSMRYKREFEEARESGLSEVQRTRHYMQIEIDTANNEVNVVREDLENQVLRARAELDQVKLDADTARVKNEMLLEEAESSKQALLADLKNKHADAMEDMQTRLERQLNNTVEDAQRHEQHLLERLSLSAAKTEHLQDRVSHLEEKLEIANQAAAAAASAAKTARSASIASPITTSHRPLARALELPEKISPQALRESIMVLQEQLQAREQTIESLTTQLSTVDLDAPTKITKRDDEIMWLRELLSVRKGDLQDIVTALQSDRYDAERVRDAAIRLHANLQMEEQERERAMNGGSALSNLPNIAASLRDAASPRVAQAVGPLAAAWGNWRKGRAVDVDAGSGSSTPSRTNSPGNQSFLSGLLTPPASSSTRGPGGDLSAAGGKQPSAFGSTGQRFTSAQLANRPRNFSAQRNANVNSQANAMRQPVNLRGSPAKSAKGPASVAGSSSGMRGVRGSVGSASASRGGAGYGGVGGQGPSTPPMMRKSAYDADARAEDFSDAGFYDDESFAGEGEGDDGLNGEGEEEVEGALYA